MYRAMCQSNTLLAVFVFFPLSDLFSEVGTCAAIIAPQACDATILLPIALAPQLFLNACADACAASNLAILSAIQLRLRIIAFNQLLLKFRKIIDEEDV